MNIWGLLDPVGNKAENRNLTDQQVTNLLKHLKTHHSIAREEITLSHMPQTTPPFPGMYYRKWSAHAPMLKIHACCSAIYMDVNLKTVQHRGTLVCQVAEYRYVKWS